jgi:membrane protein required for colicin V production
MGFIDIVLGALLAYGVFKGFKNGLIVELASLVSLYIGIYVAVKFSSVVGNALGDTISSSKTGKVIAFVLTFLAVVVGIHYLAKALSKIASIVFLGWLNKLGGVVFGLLKTVLIIGIVLSLFQKVNYKNALISKETQDASLFFNPILKTSEFFLPIVSNWFDGLKK